MVSNEIRENEQTKQNSFSSFKIFAKFYVFSTLFSRKFLPFSRNFYSIFVREKSKCCPISNNLRKTEISHFIDLKIVCMKIYKMN